MTGRKKQEEVPEATPVEEVEDRPAYCGECSPWAGPFLRREFNEHMIDVHPGGWAYGHGPPWNSRHPQYKIRGT